MKKTIHTLFFVFTITVALLSSNAIALGDNPVRGNIRIVIGSKSTGGDTYQNSAIVAKALADKIGSNVKVDAVGASAAFKALKRSSKGNTIMIFHDQSYLGYLYGVKGYNNIFADYIIGPTISINPGNAYLVPMNSPYNGVKDIIDACGNGTTLRVGIQPGGVSEIGFSALKNAIKLTYPGKEGNLVAVNTGSQANKNQLIFDKQADIIQGSVQANEQYSRLKPDDQKAMKFVWLTARKSTIEQVNPEGMGETTRDQFMKFISPNQSVTLDGKKDFTFDKEFFFIYNKDMDPKIVAYLDDALEEIYNEGKIQEIQKKSFFIPNFKRSADAKKYLENKSNTYKKVISSIK